MREDEARRVADSVLSGRFAEFRTGEWVLTGVEEYDSAWAFYYNTHKYVDSGDLRDALAGNGALVVPKAGGEPWFTWSGADTASQVVMGHSALEP